MNFEIEDIKKLNISENDALVIKVDIDGLPRPKARSHMGRIHSMFKEGFPDTHVYVIPKSMEISIINKDQLKTN